MQKRTSGYKGFSYNPKTLKLFCQPKIFKRPTHFEEGKVTKIKGEIIPCKNGIHFCKEIRNVLNFYGLDMKNFYAEVSTGGEVKESAGLILSLNKLVAKSIRIDRIMNTSEVLKSVGYFYTGGTKVLKDLEKTSKRILFETPELFAEYREKLANKETITAEVRYYERASYEKKYCLVSYIY